MDNRRPDEIVEIYIHIDIFLRGLSIDVNCIASSSGSGVDAFWVGKLGSRSTKVAFSMLAYARAVPIR